MESSLNFSTKSWEDFVTEHDAVLLYLHNDRCGVCSVLHPQVKRLVESKFPLVELVELDAADHRELAAQIRMMTVPGIILYMAGREVFRANGLVSLADLERMILRPYRLMFN